MTSREVARLVQRQLEEMAVDERAAITPGLVEPFCVERDWDYPSPEHAARYACWTVWAGSGAVDIAYSDGGFGPRAPWGLVWRDPSISMGPDYCWHSTLTAAFAEV